jgi:hypothetical protein
MRYDSRDLFSRLGAAALAAAALTLSGCAEEFTPGSVVEDLRVLALVAEPPELDGRVAGATVRVAAVEATPPGFVPEAGLTRAWTFCPFTLGAATAYRCAVPQCETALTAAADGAVTVDPVAEALQCLAAFGGTLPPEVLGGGALPDQVEVVVRYRVLRPASGGAAPEVLREAVQRIPVWTTAPTAALNTSPVFATPGVSIGGAAATACSDPAQPATPACPVTGTLPPGGRLLVEVAVTPDSFQDYPVGERTATETLAVSFFTSAGRFTEERGAPTRGAPTTSTELEDDKLVAPGGRAFVWAVVRDLRGGQAAAGPYLVAVPATPAAP